jgi:hypothetical protein
VKRFRDFSRGDALTVHLDDDSTVAGVYRAVSRRYLRLERYSIEANGVLHAMKGDALLVPVVRIKIVEVVAL